MLIIAIPKSASTALVATLSESHALPIETQRVRDDVLLRRPIANGYWHLAQFHRRDCVEIDEYVADLLAARGSLTKFHFPPTSTNQRLLERVPKLILLRDAAEIVSAYRRGEESGAYRTKSYEFAFCFSETGWQHRARRTGLTDELLAFGEGWRAHAGDKLVVESAELLASPAAVLARVESYFGLALSGAAELRRERFSRSSKTRGVPVMLWRRRRLVLRRAVAEANRLVTGNADWANRQFERFKRTRAWEEEEPAESR